MRARVQQLEDDLLERDNIALELRFDKELASLQRSRLERRANDLEAYINAAQIGAARAASLAAAVSAGAGAAGRGKSKERSVQELEDVIEAMKRVTEKLRTENAMLKRSTQSNVCTLLCSRAMAT